MSVNIDIHPGASSDPLTFGGYSCHIEFKDIEKIVVFWVEYFSVTVIVLVIEIIPVGNLVYAI